MDKDKNLAQQIRDLLKAMGWSQAKFCEMYLCHTQEEIEDEARAVQEMKESLKKQLQRPTTRPEVLQRYLDFLLYNPANPANIVRPQLPPWRISASALKEISKQSRMLTEVIKKKEIFKDYEE